MSLAIQLALSSVIYSRITRFFALIHICSKWRNARSQQGEGDDFPYILLNEIQTMFSELAPARVSPADFCTDHAHFVKFHRPTVLRRVSFRSHRPWPLSPLMKFTQGRTICCFYITLRWYFKLEMFMKVEVSSFSKKKIYMKDNGIGFHDLDGPVYYPNH